MQRDDDGWSNPAMAVLAEQISARGIWLTDQSVEIVEPELPHVVDHVPFGDTASPSAETHDDHFEI
ncbi:hypothetical protein [Nonomuraea basaltis]|uniref:hypothetical protein n=1 Tax=Nonomuraea basaltis TaxID=2495887 RepID=UPI00110C4C58|nr:hypothetical protein [Nonomuraea basaltis]TMR99529.1 hypothetical protein EJK15_06870 [Nonomuraea basaltis]